MRPILTTILVAATVCITLSAMSSAEPPESNPPETDQDKSLELIMYMFDKNEDGNISSRELDFARPTLALLGESGPEAVIPLDRTGGPFAGMKQVIQVMLDGTMIGEAAAENLPEFLSVNAGLDIT